MINNPIKLLTRLFNRDSGNAVVAELYAKAINQPLFVHPALGEMVIQGYLHSDISQLAGDAGRRGENQSEATVGILDISGVMVARYTPGPCSRGPLSYEEIRDNFDAMMADPNITTIIGRFDTPGGMAAQNIDLADHIYHSRGQGKRLIAMVDDMAYSAGFALASAFDEIWVTRTGGVGSVGVVSYHVDQTEFNNKLGVKIEYLHAGARKIDGHPHAPLSHDAHENFMAEINRLYDLFADTTARNLKLSVDDVKATEAGVFHGERAVEVGFAHKLGTFNELLQSLIPQGKDHVVSVTMKEQGSMAAELSNVGELASKAEGQALPDPNQGNASEENDDDPENGEGNAPEANSPRKNPAGMKKSNVPESIDNKQAEQIAAEIRAICAAAKVPDAAADYITARVSVEQVRKDLFDMLTTGDQEINASIPVALVDEISERSRKINTASVYEQRRQSKQMR